MVFDKYDRSFSQVRMDYTDKEENEECSTIFRDGRKYSYHTIMHELLHQFGAIDLYYPKTVSRWSKQLLGKSIMREYDGTIVDELTAYLIGWIDSVSEETFAFLQNTAAITSKEYSKTLKKELMRFLH